MRAPYDLAVVGAGFAGLACAQAAAVRGTRTVVFDRKTDVGAACHTTGILVKEVADAWDVPRDLVRPIHGVRLYGPSLRWIDLASPGYVFLATDTPAFMRHLADQATSAGASLRLGESFSRCRPTSEGFRVAIGGNEQREVDCRFLIGADGARSRVARELALGANRRFLVGAEVELAGVRGIEADRLHVLLDARLAKGYIAWAVPGVGVTQIGLATTAIGDSAMGVPLAARLDRLLARIAGVFDLSDAKIVARRGGLIPCGGPVRPWRTNRAMLLGDAAGMVSPLTAGGIHPAMQLGRLAGVAVANHLFDAGPEPWRAVAAAAPSFACKRWMRTAFERLPANWLFDRLLGSASFRRLAQVVFFHHRGLFSLEAWREMLLAVR